HPPPRSHAPPPASDHAAGMAYLIERCGPIPYPEEQAAALKWLLGYYPLEQCCACLDALLGDDWRRAAVSWLTVKKEIGTWLARKERRDETNGQPQSSGRGDHAEAGRREPSREERIRADLLAVSEQVSYDGAA